jgi:hypothetical protein
VCMPAELKFLPEVVGLLTAVTDLRLHDNFIEDIPKGDVAFGIARVRCHTFQLFACSWKEVHQHVFRLDAHYFTSRRL